MTIIIWFESESSININKLKPYKVIVYISGCKIQAEKKAHKHDYRLISLPFYIRFVSNHALAALHVGGI